MELVTDTGGRPSKILSREQLEEVTELAAILNKTQLADYFGMTEKTFRAVEERQPEVFTAYRKGRAHKIARVASQLMKATERGDMRAIQFFLKTQGGWSEKNQLQIEAVSNAPEQNQVEIKVVDSICPKCKEIQRLDDD